MWQRIKNGFRGFMSGRYGTDQLGLTLLICGVVLSLLSGLVGLKILYYLGLAMYIWELVRMFSRSVEKRRAENQKFLELRRKSTTSVRQFFVRLKNSRKYKYFRCPQCKSRLRLPRKVGEVTVTCSKCQNKFKQKA